MSECNCTEELIFRDGVAHCPHDDCDWWVPKGMEDAYHRYRERKHEEIDGPAMEEYPSIEYEFFHPQLKQGSLTVEEVLRHLKHHFDDDVDVDIYDVVHDEEQIDDCVDLVHGVYWHFIDKGDAAITSHEMGIDLAQVHLAISIYYEHVRTIREWRGEKDD